MVRKRNGKTSKKNRSCEDKNSLGTLLTFLGVFSGLWLGLLQLINLLIRKQSELSNGSLDILILVLLVFSFYVFFYILTIVRAIFYHTALPFWGEISKKTLQLKQQEIYCYVMNDWVYTILGFIPILLMLVYRGMFGNFGFLAGVVLTVILFLEWFFLYINKLFKKRYMVTNWNSFKKLFWNKQFKEEMKKVPRNSLWGIIGLVLYCLTVIIITSGVDIQLNQERYTLNETVVVKIQPYGIIPPQLIYVYYSNKNELVYNGTNEFFKASLRIVQIPSDLLTDKNYNSHINVVTSYLFICGNTYFGEKYLKRIPVYIPIEKKSFVVENTAIINNTTSNNLTNNKTKLG
jgi:hypothetical protein